MGHWKDECIHIAPNEFPTLPVYEARTRGTETEQAVKVCVFFEFVCFFQKKQKHINISKQSNTMGFERGLLCVRIESRGTDIC